eukprot:CAMPEP_0184978316 /NCGR_PEP_ID=MMETSP1098-20130426/8851_1 /TAXON_ID=89044 /ORGANISM="Spumella elongata, Strain CCAP 955/1" /LENGTH=312 /DNA_ID=CAMNT_0027501437 /DNA_START=47 /DNA_END=985 /DNA_ORIENTATION=+
MGGGASIEIKHTHSSFMHITDSHFQELLASKTEREKLFDDVASFQVPGHKEPKGVITLLRLAAYFTDNTKALYPGFCVNVDTLNAAFKYTIASFRQRQSFRKGNSKRIARNDRLTKPMFHSFLPTLLLFMRVWDVFTAADKLVVEDQKVFKGEFMRIKDKLNNLHGITILGETSDEAWEKEFELLDKNKDSYITFEETCNYALAHIKRPFDYNPIDDDKSLDEDEELDDENELAPEPFVEVISNSLSVTVLAPETISESPVQMSEPLAAVSEDAPVSPRSPRSPRAAAVDPSAVDAVAEEGEPLASARILYV